MMSNPCSTAHPRPRKNTAAFPNKPRPSTLTLVIRASGASEWMMPAHAVPWPKRSVVRSTFLDDVTVTVQRECDAVVDIDAAVEVGMIGIDAAVDHSDAHARDRWIPAMPIRVTGHRGR